MPVTNLPPPNRRQRRAAERYVKRHGLSGPAPRGPHPQDYSALVRALDVPPDGLGADILRVTAELARVQTEFSASTDYDTIKAERNAVWRSYDFENTLADGLRRWRECNHKMGAMCESCGNMRCVPADMKRCTRCQQVTYCNTECQKQHWPNHKAFCDLSGPKGLEKDILGGLLRSFMANPYLCRFIADYARTVLDIGADYRAGLRWCVDLVCTLVPDPAHARARHAASHRSMLQVARASKRRIAGVTDATVRRDTAYLLRDGPDVQVVCRMAYDGAAVGQTYHEVLPRALMVSRPSREPVVLLAMLNLFIREDVDNQFRLRLPAWWQDLPRSSFERPDDESMDE